MQVIDDIPIKLSPRRIIKELRLKKENSLPVIQELLQTAESLIQPKISYRVAYISSRREDNVEIDGVTFSSRVLRINLDKTEKVFPYIITIGKDLEDKASSFNDLLRQFYLENIGDIVLRLCEQYLEKLLKRQHGLKKLSSMSPGTVEDWPVTEQKPLFSMFGEELILTGVKLNESMMMIPRKSVSGIYFPTEVTFISCRLCARERCPARIAPYDEKFRIKYGLDVE